MGHPSQIYCADSVLGQYSLFQLAVPLSMQGCKWGLVEFTDVGDMLAAPDSKRSGFESWLGSFVLCFWARDLHCFSNSHSATLHPGVQMGTSKLSGKPYKMGGVAILLVTLCSQHQDKLQQYI